MAIEPESDPVWRSRARLLAHWIGRRALGTPELIAAAHRDLGWTQATTRHTLAHADGTELAWRDGKWRKRAAAERAHERRARAG